MMNWSDIQRGWVHYHASAKQRWDNLSDGTIAATFGKRENLTARIQEAYGLGRPETDRQISEWQSRQQAETANEIKEPPQNE